MEIKKDYIYIVIAYILVILYIIFVNNIVLNTILLLLLLIYHIRTYIGMRKSLFKDKNDSLTSLQNKLDKSKREVISLFYNRTWLGGKTQVMTKGVKVCCLIVILAVIVPVFGGTVLAEDLSQGLTKSVTDTELFDEDMS